MKNATTHAVMKNSLENAIFRKKNVIAIAQIIDVETAVSIPPTSLVNSPHGRRE
jgi:hypothetical protein